MKHQLQDLVHIHTGIYTKPQLDGEVYYVQGRHFDQNRKFITSVKPDLAHDPKLEKHFLVAGDVLVAAKGYEHFAVAYQGKIKPAVASSMFIVLRIDDQEKLLPDFLAWFINLSSTQAILSGNARGTSLPSINKSTIGELEISLPSLAQQESILKIQSLRQLEVSLQQQLTDLRDQYIQQLIINTLN